jgi:hypothetical protein
MLFTLLSDFFIFYCFIKVVIVITIIAILFLFDYINLLVLFWSTYISSLEEENSSFMEVYYADYILLSYFFFVFCEVHHYHYVKILDFIQRSIFIICWINFPIFVVTIISVSISKKFCDLKLDTNACN